MVKLRTERPTKIIELKELMGQNHIDYLCAGFDYIESNYNKNDAKLLKQIFLWDDVLVSRINNNYYTDFSVEITGGTGSIRTQSAYSYLEQIKAYATANAYRYDGKGFVYAADGKNSGSGYYPSVLPNGSQDSLSLSWTKQAGKLKIIKQPAN